MRRTIVAMSAACVLSACAFSSERPLFAADSGATPFADGERFEWREHPENADEERIEVTYRLRGASYEIIPDSREDRPMEALFIALPDTPEEDYVAQLRVPPDESERVYAFFWRSGDRFKVISAPGAFDDSASGQEALARLCQARPNGECQFDSARSVLEFYRAAVYPTFVRPDADWHGLAYQIPRSRAGKQ